MLMIRFQRIGRKNDAAFRIAVLEKTAGPKAGKYVDLVGTYNPKTKATTLKPDLIKSWTAKGAQMSPSVHNLLVKEGIVDAPKSAKVVSKTNLEKNVAKRKAEEEAAAEKVRTDAEAAAQAAATEAETAAPATEESVAEPASETVPEETPAVETPATETADEDPTEAAAPTEEVAPAAE